jgi:tripartite-type tricarboxylate transporter receptor subunit TctC
MIADLADVPTVAESGYKNYELDLCYGLLAPAKTSQDVVSRGQATPR